ncbi:nitroreductase [Paludibacter propionicigenes WB4]|uniref:Nitroreductase n=1 Tax=Paludibacter propionicigenes (strain DSM 17365 / JCM 13257 / WB4) TaxID=694427 RepID=E4T5X6_PALPW|nr:SagB/ThcOx family dehydrogenase [Paludibacter propionicigenes]ADQ80120.1 nitroreductase [Paludibacter propionicigenes WB4]
MKNLLIACSLLLAVFATAQTSTKTNSAQVPMVLTTFDTIKLQAPDTLGGKPLMQAISRRKTDRSFDSRNLSLKHLSEILWVANGVNRAKGKRTVPSAMGLYPLQTYAVLANGIYLYNPLKQQLEPVIKGDFRNLAGTQNFVEVAPLNLLFIAKARNANDNFQSAIMDSGYCGQNVYLYCASEGLRTVVRASAKDAELLKVMNLGSNYKFILAQTVGY